MSTHLLTGATGFVGGAIVLELIDRTSDEIFAVVRGDDQETATDRLTAALTGMAVGYGRPDLAEQVPGRVRAVCGDITAPNCGVDPGQLPRIDEFWHSAASLRFEDDRRAEIEEQNIGGTRNALDLARAADTGVYNQISTAYVAGRRSGRIMESDLGDEQLSNNCYEQTKVAGERMVLAAGDDLRVRIMRPSIVIGHSVTRHGVNFSGVYGFARQSLQFRNAVSERLGTFLAHTRLRLLAEPDIRANLIPIDLVARNAVTISRSDSTERFFHLANRECRTVGDVATLILRVNGLREPIWVTDEDGFTSLDAALNQGASFYRFYWTNDKDFDLTNTDAVCGRDASALALPDDELAEYFHYYLRQQPGFDAVQLDRVLHQSAN